MTLSQKAELPLILGGLIAVACGGAPQEGPGGPGGGMPPSAVEIVTLAPKPIEQTTEFVATLKSRGSSSIMPQVEGFITRIAVRSGDRVAAGTTLFEVDSAPQQAVLGAQQSMRAARAAEVEYARDQAARARKLFEAGAASERDAQEAETAFRTAEAQLKAAEEQVSQQRAQLGYYKVTAPTAGIVGDIPVRPGDRVTSSTMLTSVDQNDALEIYVSVPVSQAEGLRTGLPIRIIDDTGQIAATNKVTFVSPSVDDATQTVLAKATVVEGRGKFRADQFVRVRILWRSDPGLTVPVTAVNRVNGQYFAFVAEKADAGLVAKQRAVQLGDIIGNDYVVREGLKAGEQLIIAGLQKIGDGAPVSAAPPTPAAPGPEATPEPTKGS
jgi:RND family efflux transporter MFP subunit